MRQLTKVILVLFILISLILGFIQSPWGKRLALHLLTRSLKQSGLAIKVESIEGSIPQKVILRDLDVKSDSWELKAKSLYIELSVMRLFRKEVFVNELKGDGIVWSASKQSGKEASKLELPFILNIRHFYLSDVAISEEIKAVLDGSIRIGRNGKVRSTIHVAAPHVTYGPLDFRAAITGPLTGPLHGDINGQIDGLLFQGAFLWSENSTAHLDGKLQGISHMAPLLLKMDLGPDENNALKMKVSYQTTHWAFGSFPIEKMSGDLGAVRRGKIWEGTGSASGEIFKQPWFFKTDFVWTEGKSLAFNNSSLQGPTTVGAATLLFHSGGLIEGQGTLSVDRLQALEIPSIPLFGSIQATAQWQVVEGSQSQQIEMQGKQIFFSSIFADRVVLNSTLESPFDAPEGTIQVSITQGNWRQFDIASATLETSLGNIDHPFQINLNGKWKHPVELKLAGSWTRENNLWEIHLDKGDGVFFNHPLLLESPIAIQTAKDRLIISPTTLRLGDGSMDFSISHQAGFTEGEIRIRHLPIDMLSLNPLDLSIGGTFDLVGSVQGKEKEVQAKMEASVSDLELITTEEGTPFKASGRFGFEFGRNRLDVNASLFNDQNPMLQLDLSVPMEWTLWPMDYYLLKEKETHGHLTFKGNVEDLFDFFDMGTHRFAGEADCRLTLEKTLAHPNLRGSCIWKNGAYENYYTGTQLQNIQAEWVGDGNVLSLRSLTAQDYQNKGSFAAQGEISLIYSELFPFRFQLSLEKLNCVEIDLVSAEATGEVEVVGNLKEAWTKGDLYISQSSLVIPDHIPRPTPKLQVTYRNPIRPIIPTRQSSATPYPLHLDLHVAAPEGIFIGGRGLNSEWKGDFDVGGTITSPSAKGKLELIKGEFVFASRRFKLTEGGLSLSGKEHEMPNLNIAATVEEKGVSIIARLKGPLNKPQLTFQSIPPLPMSSILAILLFGEDLSEINGVQALQLANAIANVAGEGPDILENTRRSIGVDRLRVITVPTGAEEGDNAIALQVGKYVAQGVIVSISQGAEDNSSNISIEVELKYGFSFQAETQQQQEQGKFTLKWNLNY